MKLIVVTRGEYSDYCIVAICSTPEKAEEAKRLYATSESEEWELDGLPEHPPGHWPYSVYMDIDGDSTVEPETAFSFIDEARPYGDGSRMSFDVWATDETHAIKIANERRTKLIADGGWETDWNTWRMKKGKP